MRSFLSLLVCVAIVGSGFALSVVIWRAAGETGAAALPPESPSVPVRIEVLQPREVEDILWLTGRIEPWESRKISAETSGPIAWSGIERGQVVKKGVEVIRIDTTPLMATHAQASARSEFTGQELSRLKDLSEAGVSSPQDLDRARTDRKLAEADLSAANTKLNRSVIHAPIDGVINQVFAEEREFVDIGTALFEVVQIDRVKALIAIPERDVARFKVGDSVAIAVDALDGAAFTGSVHRIATSADRATRTFATEVALDNADGRLKPGMTVRARLVRSAFEQAIAVPLFAMISMENQYFVVLEHDGVATLTPVVPGRVQGDRVHIREGLSLGDRLIVEGHRDLRSGQTVRVMDEKAG